MAIFNSYVKLPEGIYIVGDSGIYNSHQFYHLGVSIVMGVPHPIAGWFRTEHPRKMEENCGYLSWIGNLHLATFWRWT
jgi:hypothetical protein